MATELTGDNSLICGDGRTIRVTFPYDITGHTIFFTVRLISTLSSTDDTNAVIRKTNIVHVNAVSGITEFILTAIDTRITPGKYVYDIQDKTAGADPSSTRKAYIQFDSDVTKRIV